MSKRAEEAALKAYPENMGMFYEADIHYTADLNKAARITYIEGYEQAEKDLALTWEDIKAICDIELTLYPRGIELYSKEYYEKALQEFNKQKKK